MSIRSKLQKSSLLLALTIAIAIVLVAQPALAACNTGGCWLRTIKMIKVASDGKIWFVINNAELLDAFAPADGCVVKKIHTGIAENALYIPVDDPERDEKYTMLLTAFSTGSPIGFSPIKDPATGWCALNSLDIR